MAVVKAQPRFAFPSGAIWVKMDDEWGVEITGEQREDGDLVGLASWDFKTREAWVAWGEECSSHIEDLSLKVHRGQITESEALDEIYSIEQSMPDDIKSQLIIN